MRSIQRRLRRLDERFPPKKQPVLSEAALRQAALKHLSVEQLLVLRDAARDSEAGVIREWTEQELEAINACNSAFQLECRRAGFRVAAVRVKKSRQTKAP